ncbi:hypothetical protein ACFU6S_44620, partial [Streptomyces sp. NPDC057456]|uniref:hypothetical protein n=1 Tax=Streptomyces sp. NPDC057456 TaxID=3346139 RepID=UPI0036958FEA
TAQPITSVQPPNEGHDVPIAGELPTMKELISDKTSDMIAKLQKGWAGATIALHGIHSGIPSRRDWS